MMTLLQYMRRNRIVPAGWGLCRWASVLVCLSLHTALLLAEDQPAAPEQLRFQVTGLFQPDRERDLRDLFAREKRITLVSLDYARAEVVVKFEPTRLWPGEKPEKYVEQFDNFLRNASRHTLDRKSVV